MTPNPGTCHLTQILAVLLLEGWIIPLTPLLPILSQLGSCWERTEITVITEQAQLSHPSGFYILGTLTMILYPVLYLSLTPVISLLPNSAFHNWQEPPLNLIP